MLLIMALGVGVYYANIGCSTLTKDELLGTLFLDGFGLFLF